MSFQPTRTTSRPRPRGRACRAGRRRPSPWCHPPATSAGRAERVAERRWAEEREDVAALAEPRRDLGRGPHELRRRARDRVPWLLRGVRRRADGRGRRWAGPEAGPGPPPGPVGAPCGVVVAGVDGAGTAAAEVVARPTTSSEPAGSPACSAMSLTFSPVTALAAERGLADVVESSAPGPRACPVGERHLEVRARGERADPARRGRSPARGRRRPSLPRRPLQRPRGSRRTPP